MELFTEAELAGQDTNNNGQASTPPLALAAPAPTVPDLAGGLASPAAPARPDQMLPGELCIAANDAGVAQSDVARQVFDNGGRPLEIVLAWLYRTRRDRRARKDPADYFRGLCGSGKAPPDRDYARAKKVLSIWPPPIVIPKWIGDALRRNKSREYPKGYRRALIAMVNAYRRAVRFDERDKSLFDKLMSSEHILPNPDTGQVSERGMKLARTLEQKARRARQLRHTALERVQHWLAVAWDIEGDRSAREFWLYRDKPEGLEDKKRARKRVLRGGRWRRKFVCSSRQCDGEIYQHGGRKFKAPSCPKCSSVQKMRLVRTVRCKTM